MKHSGWQGAAEILAAGIEQLDLVLTESTQQQLLRFLQLLEKWNQSYNLTSITDAEPMVIKHLLDSLAILPWIKGGLVLDVGSGAGIPGIPLAVCLPGINFTLLDTNGKKVRFMRQAISELNLTNVAALQSRIETFSPEQPFSQIICRAYAPLKKFAEQVTHLLHPEIMLLAMKGQLPVEEIEQLQQNNNSKIQLKKQHELRVPYLEEQRHLLILMLG